MIEVVVIAITDNPPLMDEIHDGSRMVLFGSVHARHLPFNRPLLLLRQCISFTNHLPCLTDFLTSPRIDMNERQDASCSLTQTEVPQE